ncbi:uncharacterized protein LOC130805048 [Amaranthus tricolor]|uniref:uncharacterized protein LOC130805048 n=1 Tax=Amaranthus tricolor TaxID=29722 RepID=UPI0025908B74|nr:uncharacterized protein LOC130805048 [Amaranthus tricolor]
MEGASSSSRKRPFLDEEDDSSKKSQKRVRFPKGKKVKASEAPEPVAAKEKDEEAAPADLSDPRIAAKERARRRSQMTTQLFTEDGEVELSRINSAEVQYQENGTFVDDGIQIEPFNLTREREEGYFDDAGNFVEYVPEKEDKDAWLDSVEVDPSLANKVSTIPKNDDEEKDLSSDDIGKIKRRIANALELGETVLQALKRLKGSNDKKVKMSAETKSVFDQLTEDAMRLMDNGDYNVYHEEREVFEREAEGYEALARARNNVVSGNDDDDAMDMFADEDQDVIAKSEQNNGTFISTASTSSQLAVENGGQDSGSSWAGQSDYVYDESSGYYYSSNLGYYYDPSTTLFCCASSGQWYKYNEATGNYDVVSETEAPSNAS